VSIVVIMNTCHVMFLRCQEREYHMINRVVSVFDPPFCHVEWVSEAGYGCSIFQNETVFFKPRRYLNERYESVSLMCTHEQLRRMNAYCQKLVAAGVEFDKTSMYSSYLRKMGLYTPWCPRSSSLDLKKTYCSKMVAEILRYGGLSMVSDRDIDVVTPSGLHALIVNSSCRVIDPLDARKALPTRVVISKGGMKLSRATGSVISGALDEDFEDSDGD
jgi:hypothetical protein